MQSYLSLYCTAHSTPLQPRPCLAHLAALKARDALSGNPCFLPHIISPFLGSSRTRTPSSRHTQARTTRARTRISAEGRREGREDREEASRRGMACTAHHQRDEPWTRAGSGARCGAAARHHRCAVFITSTDAQVDRAHRRQHHDQGSKANARSHDMRAAACQQPAWAACMESSQAMR